MNIQFKLIGSKSIRKIYIRLYRGAFDLSVSTNLVVLEADWSAQNECSKTDNSLNETLLNLKLEVLRAYNIALSKGFIVNKFWLESTIKLIFNRPTHEENLMNENYTIYFSDFCDYWMKNYSTKWKTSARKLMSKVLISQYKKFVEDFINYEKTIDSKILLKDFTQEQIYEYVDYLNEQNYSISTIERSFLGRLRFFMNRAKSLGYSVSNDYSETIYLEKEEDIDGVYLSETEIKRIIDKDFSFDQELNIAKQNYLILLHTGLRGSDGLKNLDISNIKDGMIKIKTQKTGQVVVIPIHKVVLDVIKQNFGNLPPRMTLSDFNKAIKIICMICDIDEVIEGKLFDSIKKRKVKGVYPKWSLISSHSCRKGFATIHYGKLPNEVICSVMGWNDNGKMLQHYVQHTKTDYANVLKDFWHSK